METKEQIIESLERLAHCQLLEFVLKLSERLTEAEEKIQKMEDLGYFS